MKYWQLFFGFCLVVAVSTVIDTVWAFPVPDSASSEEKAANSLASDSCITEPLNKEPRSLTVIKRSQIEQQTILTRDLNQILKRLVPSYGFSRLRGRRPAILIDGVPVFTDLRFIAPVAIERIEVIPQATASCKKLP